MSRFPGTGPFTKIPLTGGMLSQSGLTTFNADRAVDGIGDVYGTASGGQTSTTLTDSTRGWPVNVWAGCTVTITFGPGSGQVRTVSSNTANTLTVSVAWSTTPVSGSSQYVISGLAAWTTTSASIGAYILIDLGASPAFPQMLRLDPFGYPDWGDRNSDFVPGFEGLIVPGRDNGRLRFLGEPSARCRYDFEYSDNLSAWTTVARLGWGSCPVPPGYGMLSASNDAKRMTPDDPGWYLADCWGPATSMPAVVLDGITWWPAGTYGFGDGAAHRYWRLRLTAIAGGGIPFSELSLYTCQ